jgi:endogenous inhibitor of DNA gyrase (YacG/DUF329 family)
MEVKCPRCKQTVSFSPKNPHRPFCSERCKLIDLGAWAEGKYAIAAEPLEEDLEKNLEEGEEKTLDDDSNSSDPRGHLH